jgi:hypothetical protein
MPIRFEPIEGDKYHFNLSIDIGAWNLGKKVPLAQLEKLKKNIDCILESKDICKRYNCTIKEAQKIHNYLYNNNKCKSCNFKKKLCYECINVCQSPLEKEMFLTFHRYNIKPTARP